MKRDKTKEEMAAELFGERLDSTIFTWQNYCGTVGVSVLQIFDCDEGIFHKVYTNK